MTFHFYKYHGAGNDFILVDNRKGEYDGLTESQIRNFCSRRFGIGSDGFIMLSSHTEADFKMDFFNPDGSGATMCGNGARCLVYFARKLGIQKENYAFEASDGMHQASITNENKNNGTAVVNLSMNSVAEIEQNQFGMFCNTGSPHVVKFVENLSGINITEQGRTIRYSDAYKKQGTNVNFIKTIGENKISVRTYERGVENETLSCGTGVTASALSFAEKTGIKKGAITVETKGGAFKVKFYKTNAGFTNIHLIGPVSFVFEGELSYN